MQTLSHLSSPPPLSASICEYRQGCTPNRWRPYSNSNDFEANAAVILIILFVALICVLALNGAIRCFLRPNRDSDLRLSQTLTETQPKSNLAAAVTSTIFSSGVKLAGVGAECAICLTEFVEGEGVQVLAICNHGFHLQCIQAWLVNHSSCPTCRRSCFPPVVEELSPPCRLVDERVP